MPNDAEDPIERMIRAQGASGVKGKRVLKEGYVGLARDFIKALTTPFRFPDPKPGSNRPTELQLKTEWQQGDAEMYGPVDYRKWMEQARPRK